MGILGLALTVFSTVKQMSAQRKMAKAQREAGAIATANQDIQDAVGRRRAAREERVRRARIIAGASASGAVGSSGLSGALGALRANTDTAVAAQTSESIAAKGISAANQRAADAESSIYRWRAFSQLIQTGTEFKNNLAKA